MHPNHILIVDLLNSHGSLDILSIRGAIKVRKADTTNFSLFLFLNFNGHDSIHSIDLKFRLITRLALRRIVAISTENVSPAWLVDIKLFVKTYWLMFGFDLPLTRQDITAHNHEIGQWVYLIARSSLQGISKETSLVLMAGQTSTECLSGTKQAHFPVEPVLTLLNALID